MWKRLLRSTDNCISQQLTGTKVLAYWYNSTRKYRNLVRSVRAMRLDTNKRLLSSFSSTQPDKFLLEMGVGGWEHVDDYRV